MKRPNRGRRAVAFLYGMVALSAPLLQGQAPAAGEKTAPAPTPAAEKTKEPGARRVSIGFRARTLPIRSLSVMDTGRSLTTTTVGKTNFDSNFNTTSQSFLLSGGLAVETRLSRRATLTTELLFNRLRYTKVTDTFSGTDDPNTANDERSHAIATENTKARLFDLPVLVHYGGFRPSGVLAHFYVAGGATARNVSSVRTTNNITNADGTKANNQNQAQVSKRTLLGATIAVGFRFVDEFNIKVTPEVRYTRWAGQTFSQNSTQSPRDQLEIGIGFSK